MRRISPTLVGDVNRTAVLALIAQQSPISRSDIARRLALSPATVTAATRNLLERGLITVVERAPSRGGRPALLLGLVASAAHALGVKIAADHLVGVRVDLDVPVLIDNDVNTLAIAERLYGRGRSTDHFLTVTIGRGVGLGIVVGGDVYRGANGGAGEFGHVAVVDDGPLCECGKRGCLEAL